MNKYTVRHTDPRWLGQHYDSIEEAISVETNNSYEPYLAVYQLVSVQKVHRSLEEVSLEAFIQEGEDHRTEMDKEFAINVATED